MRILPGMYADQETGLYYNMARYYDPKIGRYISSDPTSVAMHVTRWQESLGTPDQLPREINPYAYVANNPLQYVDPSGQILFPPFIKWWRNIQQNSICGAEGGTKFPEYSFGQACRNHDNCYGTCGANKTWCDFQFEWDTKQSCRPVDWSCGLRAQLYFEAVLHFGNGAYNRAQEEACKGGKCKR